MAHNPYSSFLLFEQFCSDQSDRWSKAGVHTGEGDHVRRAFMRRSSILVWSAGTSVGPAGGSIDRCHSRRVAQLRSSEKGDEDTHAGKGVAGTTGKRPSPPHREAVLFAPFGICPSSPGARITIKKASFSCWNEELQSWEKTRIKWIGIRKTDASLLFNLDRWERYGAREEAERESGREGGRGARERESPRAVLGAGTPQDSAKQRARLTPLVSKYRFTLKETRAFWINGWFQG